MGLVVGGAKFPKEWDDTSGDLFLSGSLSYFRLLLAPVGRGPRERRPGGWDKCDSDCDIYYYYRKFRAYSYIREAFDFIYVLANFVVPSIKTTHENMGPSR